MRRNLPKRARSAAPFDFVRLETLAVFTRSRCLAALTVIAPTAVVTAADPDWVARVGLDLWNVPALRAEIETARERCRELGAAGAEVCDRIELKEALVRELIAGRMTLAEVADQFLILNQSRPDYLATIRNASPGATDIEASARNVIGFVLPRLAGETPARRDEITARLDAQLGRLVASGSPGSH